MTLQCGQAGSRSVDVAQGERRRTGSHWQQQVAQVLVFVIWKGRGAGTRESQVLLAGGLTGLSPSGSSPCCTRKGEGGRGEKKDRWSLPAAESG